MLIIYALIILLAYNWLYKSTGLLKDGQVIIVSRICNKMFLPIFAVNKCSQCTYASNRKWPHILSAWRLLCSYSHAQTRLWSTKIVSVLLQFSLGMRLHASWTQGLICWQIDLVRVGLVTSWFNESWSGGNREATRKLNVGPGLCARHRINSHKINCHRTSNSHEMNLEWDRLLLDQD